MKYITELEAFLPKDRISTNTTILEQHSQDESYHTPSLPVVVIYPENAEEVSRVMEIANNHKVPVVPFGLGSSLEGHVIPYHGGISIDFSLMDKIIDVMPDDFLVKVQPGVSRSKLNQELKKHGLFFSVDPGADATLGGMAATNASGTTSVKYGIMRDQVRDLEVVLADGTIMHTGNLAAKSSSGYNLNGLFTGSEGTLGCFTELTLRVYGIPEMILAGRATFHTIDSAVDAVVNILSAGIQVARIELVDEDSIKQVNKYSETNYAEMPTLFIEFRGNEAGLMQDIEFTKEILADLNHDTFEFEKDTQAQNKLWEARHTVAYAYKHGFPGKQLMTTDVCLPLSELAGAIKSAKQALKEYNLDGGIVGHVGDGNYHTTLMFDTENPVEVENAEKYNKHIVEYALNRGGSCTGEHGVGIGKMKYQAEEHGKALQAMKAIKLSLDPNNILNPGKIFPNE
ncbi:2-hydroxy-acid oxidase [Virgibacillus phasianinus]|uniref:D-lactate dehydrogenase (cytochrome) n=1 Tax=Virgibacillus phasianinus TaxID=2017483 RepID=A0A220TZP2_9BACI|nr:FAD-linked oxidase C-terminal domain-containing protein [Virgibacillus phasianinus]ASK61146.1 2-hydroxy-acid oxidase [Virgibacillus phasianinus]